jgi:hypothetical protein
MLDPIQYEFRFFQNTLADPEPEPGPEPGAGTGAKTSIFRLQLRLRPKVSAPAGSGRLRLRNPALQSFRGLYLDQKIILESLTLVIDSLLLLYVCPCSQITKCFAFFYHCCIYFILLRSILTLSRALSFFLITFLPDQFSRYTVYRLFPVIFCTSHVFCSWKVGTHAQYILCEAIN